MRYALALVALAAVGAAAQNGDASVAYQAELLARPLTPDVKAYCDQKVGPGNQGAYDKCRVTRLFLADLAAGKNRGFPLMTDIRYASPDERQKIADAMTNNGG